MQPTEHDQPEAVGSDPAFDLLDELPEDPAPQPQRLAGVGAALGSCFSVMFVVLAIGSVGSLSGPRSGIASETRLTGASASQPSPAPSVRSTIPYAEAVRLQSLERASILARAEVQAAESRLALLRSQIQHRALKHADQAREQAGQVESKGSPYDWMTSEQVSTQTLDRARDRLNEDLAGLQSVQDAAEAELARLRTAAEDAELALSLARRQLTSVEDESTPAQQAAGQATSADTAVGHPRGLVDRDLRPLIARHHASLLGATPVGISRD